MIQADILEESIFHVHNISKIYQMGEVEVPALRNVNFEWIAVFESKRVAKKTIHRR
jgi:hypothetical protein